jgi:hypothetical protein
MSTENVVFRFLVKTESMAKYANAVSERYPIVKLYHGSFQVNKQSILANGIIPKTVDADRIAMMAIDEVAEVMKFADEKKDELSELALKSSIDRIQESKFDKVYLSGELDYAINNAKAGSEWYENIVSLALRIANQDYYELIAEYQKRTQKLERELEQQEKKDFSRQHDRLKKWNILKERYDALQKEKDLALSLRRKEIAEQKKDILKKRFGDEAIIFEVEMPYEVFVSKIASPYSKERVQLFESMYAAYLNGDRRNWFDYIEGNEQEVWQFFREVHLTGVEPRFITGWKELE